MNGADKKRGDAEDQAIEQFTACYLKAIHCFTQLDTPQWKRTQEAMLSFKGLPLDTLPPRLQRRIDSHFGWINSILERYPLKTWNDYQKISSADLTRIEKIIGALIDAE